MTFFVIKNPREYTGAIDKVVITAARDIRFTLIDNFAVIYAFMTKLRLQVH